MLRFGEDPNHDTFVGVLSACAQVGLVEEGFYYLYELIKEKGVKPCSDHYQCIINMLVKAGQLNEALSFYLSTPSKWDVIAWPTLFKACHEHSNYSVGIRAAGVMPDDVASTVGEWCGVTEVMGIWDINGERGWSWVEIEESTYYFGPKYNGDSRFDEIDQYMKQLFSAIKGLRVKSDTDVEDEIVGDCDGYHSEEIAVAFALMSTHKMAPICIIKSSGKISSGCHSLMKILPKATQRLIKVRDAYHFHTFHDGHCSCADYW